MKKLKKDITFIYMDTAEKSFMEILAEEASKRNYKVTLTDNKFSKCEIGVYCQHINFPQYSKFSVIMLHDIIQQYGNWPDLWLREPWNKYNIGILPSDQWVENWNKCSQYYYARPKNGMYKVGWPKADSVANINIEAYKENFYKKYGLDLSKKTVLYAPAWENDNKQDEFVQAMLELDVNILIKQYPATPDVQPMQYKNICEMYEMHKDNKRVTILEPKMNIFNAIIASDILISEESSTMAEALMMGIPSISVSNWLIPDVTPSRYPKCDYEFVTMTTKEKLKDCTETLLKNYGVYKKNAEEWRDRIFCNIGSASKIIMDIIDDYVEGTKVHYNSLKSNNFARLKFKHYIKHKFIIIHREIYYNYVQRYLFVRVLWKILRFIKRLFNKNSLG